MASSCSWRSRPSGPISAKPAEITQSAFVPLRSASSAAASTLLAGQADDAQVDVVGDLLDGAVGPDAGHGLALAVDGVRGAGEAAGEHVAEQLAADGAAAGRGADDGDGGRLEEGAQGGGDGDVVALVDALPVALGGREREAHLVDAALEGAGGAEADVLEDPEHGGVLGQHLGDEGVDAVLGGPGGELLEQAGADAVALIVVGDRERRLGGVPVAQPDVVAERHDPLLVRLAHDADERALLLPVGLDEGAREALAGGGEAVEAEEAAVDGEAGEELDDGRGVVADGRAQAHGASVPEDHVHGVAHTVILPETRHRVKRVRFGAGVASAVSRSGARKTRSLRLAPNSCRSVPEARSCCIGWRIRTSAWIS